MIHRILADWFLIALVCLAGLAVSLVSAFLIESAYWHYRQWRIRKNVAQSCGLRIEPRWPRWLRSERWGR